ncbi:TPA: hypothetical protein DEP21_04080 [Patescibacteria group bacterium]|nr:hypothetical protein [Candidatus Gracilibacteria bacterium]
MPEYLDQVKADVNDLNLKIDKSADANLVALSKKRLNENISKEKDLIAMITPYVPGGALDTNMMAKQEDKDKADADKLLSSFN